MNISLVPSCHHDSCNRNKHNQSQYAYAHNKQDNIIAWMDSLGDAKNEECLHEILFPERIRDIDFDILAVAIRDESLREDISKQMMDEYNVPENRIVFV